jgi:hypothetical protein
MAKWKVRRPLKVGNCPNFLACRWNATYHWKELDKGYNFSLDLTSIKGLHTKLWASKVARIPILRFFGLSFWGPGTKWHLGASLVVRHRKYYKGKMVASPKSRSWWVLWVRVCLWWPKVFQLCTLTNLLFDLCRSMWVIDMLVNLPSPHPKAPTHPSTHEMLRVRERVATPSPSIVFTFGLAVESIKELRGVLGVFTWFPLSWFFFSCRIVVLFFYFC